MIFLILILALIIRLIGSNQSLWLDEAAQLMESVRPFGNQFDIQADFQPPLFHLILHYWLYLSRNEVILRLLPILLGIATIYVSYLLFKELFNQKIALITSILISLSPFHVWYSQEIRPYSLSALLGILTTYFLFKKKVTGYILTAILAIYSTYFIPFLLIAHGIYLYLNKKQHFRKWCISMIVVFVFFLPWYPFFIRQLSAGKGLINLLPGWDQAVSVSVVKAFPLVFFKFILGRISFDNKILYGLISIILFGLYSLLLYKSYKNKKYDLKPILFFLLIPVFISFIISIFLPIIAPQRLLFCLPFFYIPIATGINTLKKNQMLTLLFFITISIYSLSLYYTNPKFQREQWRQAVNFVETNSLGNSKAMFVFPDAFAPWQWYNHDKMEYIAVASNFVVSEEEMEKYSSHINSADRIFLFHYLMAITDPSKIVIKFLEKQGFSETITKDYPGVGFISIYEKTLAKI